MPEYTFSTSKFASFMLKSNRAHKKFLYSIINTKYNILIEEDIDTMYHENYIKAKNST